jgi:hypothetical protein
MAVSFKGAHFPQDIILTGVRWYVAYPLSTRHVEELMRERGVHVDHSTVNRWVIKYSPQLEGVVNLLPVDMMNESEGARLPGSSVLCGGRKVRDVLPGAESLPQFSTVFGGGEGMTSRAEVLCDGTIRREEALGVPW